MQSSRLRLMRPFVAMLLLALMGCAQHGSEAAGAAPAQTAPAGHPQDEKPGEDKAVVLSPEDASRMDIHTASVQAARYVPEVAGFGFVLSHDAIAQAVADFGTALAQSKQSQAALLRLEHLAGTAGAEPVEMQEAAQRQAAADGVALSLAQNKLSALLGSHLMGASGGEALLQALASGRTKVARVTFTLGANLRAPRELRLARLDSRTAEEQWRSRQVWPAPADPGIPGRSYFALLPDVAVEEGERLSVWAPEEDATALSGAWIPASAVVAEGGRYWCYVRNGDGRFIRVALDINHPLRDGYFVQEPKAGDTTVTVGAGLLLAKELNPDTEAGD